eukprot:ANDGO_06151.mRNA.1 hypothetical protein
MAMVGSSVPELNARILELESLVIPTLKSAQSDLQSELSELEFQLSQEQAKLEGVQSDLQLVQADVSQSREKTAKLTAVRNELVKTSEMHRKEEAAEIEAIQKQVGEAKAALEKARLQRDFIVQESDGLKRKLEESQRAFSTEETKLSKEASSLRSQIEDLELHNAKLQSEMVQLNAERETTEKITREEKNRHDVFVSAIKERILMQETQLEQTVSSLGLYMSSLKSSTRVHAEAVVAKKVVSITEDMKNSLYSLLIESLSTELNELKKSAKKADRKDLVLRLKVEADLRETFVRDAINQHAEKLEADLLATVAQKQIACDAAAAELDRAVARILESSNNTSMYSLPQPEAAPADVLEHEAKLYVLPDVVVHPIVELFAAVPDDAVDHLNTPAKRKRTVSFSDRVFVKEIVQSEEEFADASEDEDADVADDFIIHDDDDDEDDEDGDGLENLDDGEDADETTDVDDELDKMEEAEERYNEEHPNDENNLAGHHPNLGLVSPVAAVVHPSAVEDTGSHTDDDVDIEDDIVDVIVDDNQCNSSNNGSGFVDGTAVDDVVVVHGSCVIVDDDDDDRNQGVRTTADNGAREAVLERKDSAQDRTIEDTSLGSAENRASVQNARSHGSSVDNGSSGISQAVLFPDAAATFQHHHHQHERTVSGQDSPELQSLSDDHSADSDRRLMDETTADDYSDSAMTAEIHDEFDVDGEEDEDSLSTDAKSPAGERSKHQQRLENEDEEVAADAEEQKAAHIAQQEALEKEKEKEKAAAAEALAVKVAFWKMMVNGSLFVKHARNGSDGSRFVFVLSDGSGISWADSEKDARNPKVKKEVILRAEVTGVSSGLKTEVLQKKASKKKGGLREDVCFSVVSAARPLDLEASSSKTRDDWVSALELWLAGALDGLQAS